MRSISGCELPIHHEHRYCVMSPQHTTNIYLGLYSFVKNMCLWWREEEAMIGVSYASRLLVVPSGAKSEMERSGSDEKRVTYLIMSGNSLAQAKAVGFDEQQEDDDMRRRSKALQPT